MVTVTMATSNQATNQNSCFPLAKIYQVGKKVETCFFFQTSLERNNIMQRTNRFFISSKFFEHCGIMYIWSHKIINFSEFFSLNNFRFNSLYEILFRSLDGTLYNEKLLKISMLTAHVKWDNPAGVLKNIILRKTGSKFICIKELIIWS